MTGGGTRRVPDPNAKLVCTPIVHQSTVGLQFWYDYERGRIATADPGTFINFVHSGGGVERVMLVYLAMGDFAMQIAGKDGKPYPQIMYRGPGSETTWVIGSLGRPLYYRTWAKDHVSLSDQDPSEGLRPVALDRTFRSRDQQEAAMTFITEALSKYDGYWLGACRGQPQSAKVHVRPELERQLADGEFLK